jgi:hypothetical protein
MCGVKTILISILALGIPIILTKSKTPDEE